MTGRPARCDVCGDVVDSLHPWDVRTCACGRLTVGGGPKHRQVQWRAEPGAGWTDLADEPEDGPDEPEDGPGDEGAGDGGAGDTGAADHEPADTSSSAGADSSRLRSGRGHRRFDLAPVDRLPLEEQPHDPVEGGSVLGKQPGRPLLGFA